MEEEKKFGVPSEFVLAIEEYFGLSYSLSFSHPSKKWSAVTVNESFNNKIQPYESPFLKLSMIWLTKFSPKYHNQNPKAKQNKTKTKNRIRSILKNIESIY